MARHQTLHNWNVTPAEAQAIQNRLSTQVRIEPLNLASVRTVAGADISFEKGAETVFAGFVVLRLPALEVIHQAGVRTQATFPYVPGLLSFRETPPLLEAWEKLSERPDALICDGQGLAHPRRFGIACHLGLLLDLPTVGCAKSILTGKHAAVGNERGDWAPLIDRGEVVGAALRTRVGVSPVYVSVGHRCDLESAIALVRQCAGPTRVPDTTRHAHLFVNALRREAAASQPGLGL
jgi:deoxyribonuclease V